MGEEMSLEGKLAVIEAELNRHSQNIENLTSIVQVCQLNDATTNVKMEQILTGITELKNSVAELKEKPAKRWDSIVVSCITSLVSGLVGIAIGFFFSK